MTKAEINFLKELLAVQETDDPWVEAGRHCGIDPRTVQTFVELGLIWTENRNVHQTWATLRKGEDIKF